MQNRSFILCWFILLFNAVMGFSQIDSLENSLLALPDDSIKVEKLLKTAYELEIKGNVEKSTEFYKRACELAREVNYNKGNINCLNNEGIELRNQGKFFDALVRHDEALKIARAVNNRYLISLTLNNMGTVYRRIDNIEKALECHLESLEIARMMRNQRGIAVSLNSIGNIYLARESYDKALETFEECIKIETRLNNKLGVAINLNNIGYIHDQSGDLEKALNYFKRSLATNQEIGSKKGLAISFNDIGRIQFKMKNYELALDFFQKALAINNEQLFKQYAVENYFNIGRVYQQTENYPEAINHYQQGLEVAGDISTLSQISEGNKMISELFEMTGKYQQSLAYFKESIKYQDSLDHQENENKITQLLTKFETESKEQKIKELQAETRIQEAMNTRRQITIIGLTISTILALTLLGVFYRSYQHKKSTNELLMMQKEEIEKQNDKIAQKNKALESKNKDLIDINLEKNNVLGIIAHDLRSPMNHIIGLTSIIGYGKDSLNKDQVQSLEMISDTSIRMREMINRILDINAMDNKSLSVTLETVNVSNLLQNIIKEFLDPANKKNITLATDIQQELTAKLDKNYTIQIIENLIANAIKFSPAEKTIFIRLFKSNGDIQLEIKDQGPGIKASEQNRLFEKFQILSAKPTAGEKSTGLGLYIVKTFVEAMKGKVWCESEAGKGANFIVSFPRG